MFKLTKSLSQSYPNLFRNEPYKLISLSNWSSNPFFSTIKEDEKHIFETITKEDVIARERVDKYLKDKFQIAWSVVQKLVRKKRVKIESKFIGSITNDPSYELNEGDIIIYPKVLYNNLINHEQRKPEPPKKEISFNE
jgi:23S rRNA-/tRNA-specific pseudouridylate synthase